MEQERKLHIVAFNVPYPPDYGGIIDVYYKILSLYKAGVKVILHCFVYERPKAIELEEICERVFFYKRKSGIAHLFGRLPFIVSTRVSRELEERLKSDSYPVLFEGLHTTLLLDQHSELSFQAIVRTHNIEHNYYKLLSRSENNLFKKVYLNNEARKLEKYEKVLKKADCLIAISTTDHAYFRMAYGNSKFVPAFHYYSEVKSKHGEGDYILFHGNLSVPENEKALIYLVNKVISQIQYNVIIAGRNPGRHVKRICDKHRHVKLISNPKGSEMEELVQNAQINLLYTYQPTGLKLKLLHSLYAGRHCLANPLMLSGSGLEKQCTIYTTPEEALQKIEELMHTPFSPEMIEERKKSLEPYGNSTNVKKLIQAIWKP